MKSNPKKKTILWSVVIIIFLTGVYLFVNRTFIYRAATYPDQAITQAAWYEPLETVAGNFSSELPLAPPEKQSISQDALDAAAEYARKKNSAALLVLHQDSIVLEKYWQGFTRESTTNSMSMAKSILAMLIGIAISEGHIDSEDDPVAKYLPEWANDERADITIKHLLQMTSGLRLYDDKADPFSDLVQMYLGTDAAATALAVPAVRPPGERFQYNNANSLTLGVLLERVTGKRYAFYLSEKIWQPIGAQDAGYWLDKPDGMARTFCCFFATGRDWLRLGKMLLHNGQVNTLQVVPESWLKRMITSSELEPDYGYQIWLGFSDNGRRKKHRSEPFIPRDMYWFDGADIQRLYIVPSYQLAIVRLGEDPGKWDDSFVVNTLIRGMGNNVVQSFAK